MAVPPSLRAAARSRAREGPVQIAIRESDVQLVLHGDPDTRFARVLRFRAGAHQSHAIAFVNNGSIQALYLILPAGNRRMVELCGEGGEVRFARTDVEGIAVFRRVQPGPVRFMYRVARRLPGLTVTLDIATEWTSLP